VNKTQEAVSELLSAMMSDRNDRFPGVHEFAERRFVGLVGHVGHIGHVGHVGLYWGAASQISVYLR
jgi:hypothetical protein